MRDSPLVVLISAQAVPLYTVRLRELLANVAILVADAAVVQRLSAKEALLVAFLTG